MNIHDLQLHFSIRKLSVGVVSCLIGICFISSNQTVQADSMPIASNNKSVIISNSSSNSNPTETKSSNKQDIVDSNNTSPAQIDSHSNQNSRSNSNPTETIASKSNNKQNIVDSNNTSPAQINSHSNQNSTKMVLVNSKLNISSQQPAAADSAENKLKTAALNSTIDEKLDAKMLSESKAISPANDTNGGFDEATWGKLNVNDWQGSVQGDYYQLTDYTGDANHIIVPNEADFAKAGISTSGKQVGVTSDFMHIIFRDKTTAQDATVAFSKTNNKQVKAIGSDWSNTWGHKFNSLWSKGKFTKFDGSNLDVSNVSNMSYMFDENHISDLTPLKDWQTSNVTDMSHMFQSNQISDLTPLKGWQTGHVTNMSYMFGENHISNLTPLKDWQTSGVTDMSGMFQGNQISDLTPLKGWQTGNVTNMSSMFDENHISNLTPLKDWQTSGVTDMSGMFAGNQISDLTPLKDWQTGNVTNMGYMFDENHISDLTGLKDWQTSNVTDMSGMFQGNQISDLTPLKDWQTSKVTDMSYMFDNNTSIPTKTIQAKRVINFVYPAGYTGKKQDSVTQTVNVPNQKVKVYLTTKKSKPSNNILDWVITKTETPLSTLTNPVYFQDYTVPEIKGLLKPDKTVISKQQADITKPINVTVTYKLVDSNTNDAFALDSKHGLHEHANVNDNGGYDADYWGKINVNNWDYTVNNDRIEINGLKDSASTGANDAVIVPNLDDFKLAGKDGGAKAVYISKNTLSKTAWHEYYGLSKTNGSKFVTDSDLNNAFNNSNLTHADLNSLNTSNVTDMSSMFNGARSLTSLDVSKWNTSNVTNMSHMFDSANSLTSLDVSKWNTSNVTNMSHMFDSANSLTSLDVSKWNTSKVIDMSFMFNGASSLTSLDVSKWDTGKVTNMCWMFRVASSLTSLDVSNWKTGNVTNMTAMFNDARSLTSLDVSNWDTSKVTNMSYMFNGARSLTSLDVSNWDTSKVTNMSYMFNGARSLTSLDVSNWDTGNVTDMSEMFDGASSLALIVNGDKFADYLVNNGRFAYSEIDSSVKSVTTDNTKLLQLLTNDIGESKSATRTIVFTFPTGYSPDLTKYHLTKNGNTYQIKQSADYDKSYIQGTVLINATDDITEHHIDTTKPYKLSDTWQPNYDKLVLAHKNADGTVSFDNVQLPKVPGYKANVNRNNGLLMVSYLVFAPEKPETNNNLNELQFSNKLATNSTVQFDSTVKSNIVVKSDMYQVVNDDHNWQLPVIKSYDLKFATNKNQIIFAYTKDKQYNYRFVLTFKDGQYRLTTFDKQGKLLKTYSIKSYKKLAKIIHSLVSMNIA